MLNKTRSEIAQIWGPAKVSPPGIVRSYRHGLASILQINMFHILIVGEKESDVIAAGLGEVRGRPCVVYIWLAIGSGKISRGFPLATAGSCEAGRRV